MSLGYRDLSVLVEMGALLRLPDLMHIFNAQTVLWGKMVVSAKPFLLLAPPPLQTPSQRGQQPALPSQPPMDEIPGHAALYTQPT